MRDSFGCSLSGEADACAAVASPWLAGLRGLLSRSSLSLVSCLEVLSINRAPIGTKAMLTSTLAESSFPHGHVKSLFWTGSFNNVCAILQDRQQAVRAYLPLANSATYNGACTGAKWFRFFFFFCFLGYVRNTRMTPKAKWKPLIFGLLFSYITQHHKHALTSLQQEAGTVTVRRSHRFWSQNSEKLSEQKKKKKKKERKEKNPLLPCFV